MKTDPPKPIIYIARDIERALGKEPSADYLVVANDGEYARSIKEKYPGFVFLVKSPAPLGTFELLERESTINFIKGKTAEIKNSSALISHDKPNILVFKNTARIEEFCAKKNWHLLNPPAALAEKIENKISQVEWLGELAELLPKFKIAAAREIKWQKKPLVLQFAHAHTGQGTILVNNENELKEIQKKFPDRPVKASEYIKGPIFTVNVVVVESRKSKVESRNKNESGLSTRPFGPEGLRLEEDFRLKNDKQENQSAIHESEQIIIGNPSYQITGMPPLSDNPFSTVGNDWSLPCTVLSDRHLDEFHHIAQKVAEKMKKSGWKGLFGIDVIYDEERDRLGLIEINARQPASTTFESQLQAEFRRRGLVGSTIFEAHLAALLFLTLTEKQVEINDGAQIVQRVTKTLAAQMVEMSRKEKIESLNKAGYTTIPYPNTKPNSDFLRIQSAKGLMEKDGKFNRRGQEIIEILEK